MQPTKEIRKELFLEIMNYRHACKLFDTTKQVNEDDLNFILECGRLSPSSIGMEQWKFVVIKSDEVKQNLQGACYNQVQVGTSSVIIAILAKIRELEVGSKYVDKVLMRRGKEVGEYYKGFYTNYAAKKDIKAWADAQCHIAGANMMSGAAFIGIDSCPIAGFDPEAVSKVLDFDRADYEISLVIPFGYRINEQPAKFRLSIDELVSVK
jgi:nitroreductase